MKICTKCGEEKSLELFSKRNSRKNSYQPWCKACAHAVRVQWARDNTDKTRQYRLRYKYGLEESEFDSLLAGQNGSCALCDVNLANKVPQVDHDHLTGRIRGILCVRCNVMLGHYKAIADHNRIQKYLHP